MDVLLYVYDDRWKPTDMYLRHAVAGCFLTILPNAAVSFKLDFFGKIVLFDR